MRCSEFLVHYSDFRDHRVSDRALLCELELHLAACRRCGLYHAVIYQGVAALRTGDGIEPSQAFRRALRDRLAAATRGMSLEPAVTPAGVVAAVLLGVAGALLLYESLAARREAELAQRSRPIPIVIVNPSAPFVSFTSPDDASQATLVVPITASPPPADGGGIAP